MKHKSFFHRIKNWTSHHKIWSVIIAIAIILIAWYAYGKVNGTNGEKQYMLAPVRIGTLIQTVTGSGQVAAENQLDVKSEVSGTILSINAKVGQIVKKGDLIVTLDSRDAGSDLENARIALAKLTEAAKPRDIVNAQNSLSKSYSDAFSSVSDAYLDLPAIMDGLKSTLYDSTGFLSDVRATSLTNTGRTYRDTAGMSYDKAKNRYEAALMEYKSLTRTSATSSLELAIDTAYDTMKLVSEALKNTQAAISFVVTSQTDYYPADAKVAAANVITWSNSAQSDLSAVLSSKNSIASSLDTFLKLKEGADALDIQSAQLSLQQKQRAYAKYFIRAPFDGVVGRIPVNVYDEAGNGTVVATVVSNRQTTTIPLNEIDAIKVQTDNPVSLTFDAVEDLTLKGIVSQVDLVGTASQGVVTYNIKIVFDKTDPRVRSGMSVDATITTEEKSGVLLVPSSAVKTQGQRSYVEVIDDIPAQNDQSRPTSTTRQFSTSTGQSRQVLVTIGESNDTDTEIISGLTAGQFVVSRTIAGSGAAPTASAPNLFGNIGGGQRTGTGAVRVR